MSRKNLRLKKGASVTEFLVAAPILALLLYAALDLNQNIEFKQGLIVSTRNAAFDNLGTQQLDTGTVNSLLDQVQPFAAKGSEGDMGSLTVSTEENLGYTATLGFEKDRAKAAIPSSNRGRDSTYEGMSATTGAVIAPANESLDTLTKYINLNGILGNVWLLPPARMRTITGNLGSTAGTSILRKSMGLVSRAAENARNPNQLPGYTTPSASYMLYLRPETAHHPDGYVAQPVIGFLLGLGSGYKEWGDTGYVSIGASPENYNHNCLMNFDGGGDQCTNLNGWLTLIKTAGVLIRTMITAGELSGVLTAPALAIDAKTIAIRMVTEEALDLVTDYISDQVEDKIADAATEALNSVNFNDGTSGPGNLTNPASFLNPAGIDLGTFTDIQGFDQLSDFRMTR
jgi:hypothetical protein